MAKNIIRRLRLEKNYEQGEFARMMGVSQATVSDWENNKKVPKSANLEKMSHIFGVSTLAILGEEDIKPVDVDDEVWSIRNDVRRNPKLRTLFETAKNAKPEDIGTAIALLRVLENGDVND